jgi:clathrin heavy chain
LPHLLNNCGHIPNVQQLAFTIAGRYNLPGVDNIFLGQFNNFIVNGDYQNAAKIASMSPGTLLRNEQTIQKFKGFPQMPGQPQPLLIYFQKLLERGKLNKLETLELCGPVIGQGKIDLVRNWVTSNKLEPCVELGDMVNKQDKNLALKIYQDGKFHDKVVAVYNELGRIDEAMKYAQLNGVQVNVAESLRSMIDMNPEGALQYAKSLYQKDKNINVREIADMFLQRNRIQEFTSLLFDCMRENRAEDANYQTKVLEVNIMIAPQIAESIMQMKIWNLYNKPKIAALCEQKGMYQRALENYTDIKDIKRVLLNSHALPPDFISEYLGRMSP